jgi:endo-1,4-beta-xylanase
MPEAGMRWNETELNVDIWLWAPGDKFVTFSTINGQYLRCHALVSPHLPTWLTGPTFSWNKNSLTTILQRHIMTMMRRYRSFCKEWDVVSEGQLRVIAYAWI